MGPLLLSRLLLSPRGGRSDSAAPHNHDMRVSTCILERNVLYPLAPGETPTFLSPWDEARDRPVWNRLHQPTSTAVHMWNGLTRDVVLMCGSLMHRLLEEAAGCPVNEDGRAGAGPHRAGAPLWCHREWLGCIPVG
jgi:hypothetical protein